MRKTLGKVEVWDLAEVAGEMEVNVETVREYVRAGKLPARKFGIKYWVTVDDLSRWARGELPWQQGLSDPFAPEIPDDDPIE